MHLSDMLCNNLWQAPANTDHFHVAMLLHADCAAGYGWDGANCTICGIGLYSEGARDVADNLTQAQLCEPCAGPFTTLAHGSVAAEQCIGKHIMKCV